MSRLSVSKVKPKEWRFIMELVKEEEGDGEDGDGGNEEIPNGVKDDRNGVEKEAVTVNGTNPDTSANDIPEGGIGGATSDRPSSVQGEYEEEQPSAIPMIEESRGVDAEEPYRFLEVD